MSPEEQIEFIKGQNTILKHALALLIVMHPNKKEISTLINKISSYPEVLSSSKSYKSGINDVIQEMDDLLKTSLHADVAASRGTGSSH